MRIDYIKKLGIEAEAEAVLLEIIEKFSKNKEFLSLIDTIAASEPLWKVQQRCDAFANEQKTNKFQIRLAVLVLSLEAMHREYKEKGITDEVFFRTIRDIAVKTKECFEVEGVYGVKPLDWYQLFFDARIVWIGRLQFVPKKFGDREYCGRGISLKSGDAVFDVHIPSSGKLNIEDVESSYREAYKYFGLRGRAAFVCDSWLLYPGYKGKIFEEGTNIFKFADMFDIIGQTDRKEFNEAWRVFKTNDIENVDSLPQETGLQKAFWDYIKAKQPFGTGYGVLVWNEKGKVTD